MLSMVLFYVLIWATLMALLWAGTSVVQDYLYSDPATQLYWRTPVAAAILTLWLAFWANREYHSYRQDGVATRYGALFEFNNIEDRPFNEFWVPDGDKKIRFSKRTVPQANRPGRPEFISEIPPYQPWSGSEQVILEENGKEVLYKIQRNRKEKVVMGMTVTDGQGAVYRAETGRKITEAMIRNGKIETARWGLLLTYAMLNLGFLALWFLGLWLLLRFQWLHALGLAVVFWFAMIMFVVPPLVERVDKLADEKPRHQASLTSAQRMCMISPSCTI